MIDGWRAVKHFLFPSYFLICISEALKVNNAEVGFFGFFFFSSEVDAPHIHLSHLTVKLTMCLTSAYISSVLSHWTGPQEVKHLLLKQLHVTSRSPVNKKRGLIGVCVAV